MKEPDGQRTLFTYIVSPAFRRSLSRYTKYRVAKDKPGTTPGEGVCDRNPQTSRSFPSFPLQTVSLQAWGANNFVAAIGAAARMAAEHKAGQAFVLVLVGPCPSLL